MQKKMLKPGQIQTHYLKVPHSVKERRIRVLLPDNYEQTNKSFPVLYMLDGQNVFFDDEAYAGASWQVYEGISVANCQEIIVIAIDNAGDQRMMEYGPWSGARDSEFAQMGGGGIDFGRWMINDFIPLMNQKYRISHLVTDTGIAGSSMGAIMTVYLGHQYPQFFGKMGVFSLASFFNQSVHNEFVANYPLKATSLVSIQVGTLEGDSLSNDEINPHLSQQYIDASLKYYQQLISSQHPMDQIQIGIHVGHKHHELFWAKQIIETLEFLYPKER